MTYSLIIHGARGSMSAAGPEVSRVGGNTTCYSAHLGDAGHLVIDAGTGLRRLEQSLSSQSGDFHFFLTHFHWDHIQGLPFFGPLYDPASTFTFYVGGHDAEDIEAILSAAINPPMFPVKFSESASTKRYVSMDGGPVVLDGIEISARPTNHPQGSTAYRLNGTSSIAIATDHEAGDGPIDDGIVDLAAGADVLIHDAQYTPDEYESSYRGWGHSTWSGAVSVAKRAGVGALVLVSHDPNRSDDAVDEIVAAAKREFPATRASTEGMALDL